MSAKRTAELLLGKRAQTGSVRQGRCQASPLLKFVQSAMQDVRAGFCDDIDESPGAASELGGCAVGHYLKLLDGIQADGERRPLAAALFAEKRIVVVSP